MGFLFALTGCAASEATEPSGPGLDTEGSAASIALVAQCRRQASACVAYANQHPCQLGDPACMTPDECNAAALSCITDALKQ